VTKPASSDSRFTAPRTFYQNREGGRRSIRSSDGPVALESPNDPREGHSAVFAKPVIIRRERHYPMFHKRPSRVRHPRSAPLTGDAGSPWHAVPSDSSTDKTWNEWISITRYAARRCPNSPGKGKCFIWTGYKTSLLPSAVVRSAWRG